MPERNASILIVAGEASGDLHGSKLLARLRDLEPGVDVFGVGGDRMVAAGLEAVYDSDEFSVMGFAEVLRHIPRLRRAMSRLVREAVERDAGLAILMDYPGFNLILAARLQDAGIRVLYYISPQVWAWGEGRVSKIRERIDRMAVILPFEVEFYRERGVEVEFVGHPLLEEPWVSEVKGPKSGLGDPLVLGLLPGSRRQEISRNLPAMLGAARGLAGDIPDLNVEIGLGRGISESWLRALAGDDIEGVRIVQAPDVHDLMVRSTALAVASGTATLEAACAGTPMAITYRTSALSYLVARSVVRIPRIGLVNVIAGEEVVPEIIQGRATPGRLAAHLAPYLTDGELTAATSRRLLEVRRMLGTPGASERVARMALEMLEVRS
ncbi:MAG: lipid-A-disaccharide synthase [Candidatus Eisenbacteria bacterium]|nr:lipid-A-disaccharide synthase [Candidatus Eisenbacteria bacterium]